MAVLVAVAAGCTGREPGDTDTSISDEALNRSGHVSQAELRGRELPRARPFGRPEPVALFFGSMPTGVTVSASGRIFVNFPRWGDPVPFTVGELVHGAVVPYPDQSVNSSPAAD
ncbi:MAG TPA: hypothetical protein VLJ38_07320, partial [Polyangiaceae bacterium]|nr:hypothetical protein [Polyangiaceae bacterium]